MGWSGDDLDAPIGFGDISTATGIGPVSGGGYDLGYMIANGSYNIAARCKPIAHPNWGVLSLAERRARNCGMTLPRYGSLSSLYTNAVAMTPGALAWTYEKPRGGSYNEPYRALDFDGYNRSTGWMQYGIFPNPCSRMQTPRVSDEGYLVSVDSIQQDDLRGDGSPGASGGYYYPAYQYNMGVAYGVRGSGAFIYAKTFTTSEIPISVSKPSSSQDYDVVCFFTDQTHDGSTIDKNGVYIPFPIPHTIWSYVNSLGLNYANCELDSLRVILDMYLGTTGGSVSYTKITVIVKDGSTVSSEFDIATTSGTLTTTQTHFGSFRVSPRAPANATFFLRFWPSNLTYYEEQFYPMESPII